MLFSLKMAVLLHKWEFKNMEVRCLEVRETIWLPGLPDIGIRKSLDFLNLPVSARTGLCFEQKYEKYQNFYLKIFSFWRWNFLYIWIGMFFVMICLTGEDAKAVTGIH